MDVTTVLAGRLRRDTLLPVTGRPLIDVPGGSLLSAAAGLTVWDSGVGLLGRVGEDYPQQWLKDFSKHGWDVRGVHILPEAVDQRYFQASQSAQMAQFTNPVAHFARLGLVFPKSLLGYGTQAEPKASQGSPIDAPRPSDIPEDYLEAKAVHLCPLDRMTTNRLTSTFRQAGTAVLTLDPTAEMMTSAAMEEVRSLVHGLTAFMPSEEELRALFWGRSDDLWEMAAEVAAFGCEFVVVKRGERGQMLYDGTTQRRWEVPAYPARLVDCHGAGDAFCGGWLAGYLKTYDPLQAVLHGNVSASLSVEGVGALHALEALPGLAKARLEAVAVTVRKE